jgi:hypothetical protein
MPPHMETAEHVHGRGLDHVEERVRKPAEQDPARIPMYRRVELRLALDRSQGGFDGQEEL